jgi:sugar O-acyltransferase (sialic acid O-acetyltransferase NeuD family)
MRRFVSPQHLNEGGEMEKSGRTIIVGAGGFGRELISWAEDCHIAGTLPPVAGLIDDNPESMDGFHYRVALLGNIADFAPLPGDHLLMAIGAPEAKQKVAELLRGRGGSFATMVHPSVVIATSAQIGQGTVLCPMSLVSADANIGQLCIINALSSIGHDVQIGAFSTLSAHVDLTGHVSLGASVTVGTGAKLLPRVKVGQGATIGAGSVVYRAVPAGRSVFAAPAKLLPASSAAATR